MTYDDAFLQSPNVLGFPIRNVEDHSHQNSVHEILLSEGGHFGDWTLLGERIDSLTAYAVGDVVCVVITKDKFESAIGPLPSLHHDDHKYVNSCMFEFKSLCV